jgi:hypothetical protein
MSATAITAMVLSFADLSGVYESGIAILATAFGADARSVACGAAGETADRRLRKNSGSEP